MKALLFSAALAASMVSAVAFADDTATQAQQQFQQRDYSGAGIGHAQQAADLYAQAAATATDNGVKAKMLVGESEALFFVGNASADQATKLDRHQKGINVADQATKLLGLADVASATDPQLQALKAKLSAADVATLAEALYFRGINLGNWGQLNGVVQSLSKWPELRRGMESIETLGLVQIHNYGAYRILGRGYFKIPSLLGGDMTKAEKYLSTAVSKTLVPGTNFSRDGFNNIYYAELLHENGDDDTATAILNAFIKADPATVDATAIPEIRQNQIDAANDLKSW